MLILGRVACAALCVAFLVGAALAQPASSEDGAFDVGPLRAVFTATQGEGGERYHRQIPDFGPTQLKIAFSGLANGTPAIDMEQLYVEVQLLWGKNELLPPRLLDARSFQGGGAVALDHVFDEDGKYIIAVAAREPGGAEYRGQYVFFVIQTADPQLFVAGVASTLMLGVVFSVWRRRRKPAPPLAPRR